MSNLNDQQFAKYSARMVPDRRPGMEYRYEPLPASMERHAPGEYQPTLPGMEKMLKGEQTHTDVFFKHPNISEKWTANDGTEWSGDIPGSNWHTKTTVYHPEDAAVRVRSLHPVQDWVDDNHLHEPARKETLKWNEGKPLVERIGRKNVLQDGHHRVARAALEGKKTVDVARWS
jgi:hypothetical protein